MQLWVWWLWSATISRKFSPGCSKPLFKDVERGAKSGGVTHAATAAGVHPLLLRKKYSRPWGLPSEGQA